MTYLKKSQDIYQVDIDLVLCQTETVSGTPGLPALCWRHPDPGLPAGPPPASVGPDTVGRRHHMPAADQTSSTVNSHPATAPPPPLLSLLQQDVPGSLLSTAGHSS